MTNHTTDEARRTDVAIIGAGMGGLTAAITASTRGLTTTLLEASPKVGGAAAYSGGQVWVGGNHVAAARGIEDSVDRALEYVRSAAHRDATSVDPERSREWLTAAADAAAFLENIGAITWDIVPDYPDYYYPDAAGSAPTGRYLTASLYDASALGDAFETLHVSPHFPVGISYGEMFAWGGMSSKTEWDLGLVAQRRSEKILSFGTGIVAPLYKAVLDRGVDLRLSHRVTSVVRDDEGFEITCETPEGTVTVLARTIILATGAHDWSPELMAEFTGIGPADGGSVVVPTVQGDGIDLALALGAAKAALPPWAAPVLPGYRLPEPAFEGDTGYRACFEHCLPHTVIVNSDGQRFADDSFHSKIVAEVLGDGTDAAKFPIFMIWDAQHHTKYGLGATAPGGDYPEGLVQKADTVAELAELLGVDADGLAESIAQYNAGATEGQDEGFGRGSNLSVRRFRGDGNQQPNPCVGPLDQGPFFGMRLRLLSTGIAAAGVTSGVAGRLNDAQGREIDGVYAVGEVSARAAAGVGYNSGYSLSRAMGFGFLAAHDIADRLG
jgi:3-oxosteroid 1-dehydrogenase